MGGFRFTETPFDSVLIEADAGKPVNEITGFHLGEAEIKA